jgi:Protein of unknown function (DUF2726)
MYYPYLKQETFFSPREKEFYLKLKALADEKSLVVFSKVRLADLVWIPKSYKMFGFFFRTIKAKQIDFVLCDAETFEIKCLIELDDPTHELPERQSRDRFVNRVIQKSGHQLIRCNTPDLTCINL